VNKRGHDYIGVGIGVVLFDENQRVFAAQRGPQVQSEAGYWDFPGGSVEFGDTLEATIVREMQEEHDTLIEITGLLDICDHIIPAEDQHWISPTYLGRIVAGTPRIVEPHKCTGLGWFTLAELEQLPLTLITQHNLRSLRQRFPELA
jgi:8-oxo-dGTP diphosphatase